MFSIVNDPQTVLTSGSTTAILALIILVLVGVIIYMNRKLDQKDDKIEGLLNQRIQDAKDSRDTIVGPLELIGRQNDLILKNINNGNK